MLVKSKSAVKYTEKLIHEGLYCEVANLVSNFVEGVDLLKLAVSELEIANGELSYMELQTILCAAALFRVRVLEGAAINPHERDFIEYAGNLAKPANLAELIQELAAH